MSTFVVFPYHRHEGTNAIYDAKHIDADDPVPFIDAQYFDASTSCCELLARRSARTRFILAPASALAIPKPMPEPAPVTIVVFPFKCSMASLSRIVRAMIARYARRASPGWRADALIGTASYGALGAMT